VGLLAIVLAAAACNAIGRTEGGGPVETVRAAAPPAAEPAPWRDLQRGWSTLAPLPAWRSSAVAVWTGRELVFWGGDTQNDAVHHADGIVFTPRPRRWRPLPPAPVEGRSQAAAAWTGREVLVWGGIGARGKTLADGAAWNPSTRSWRTLPPSPLGPRIPAASAWTGRELIVWGDASRGAEDALGAAYDPRKNRWRTLPPAPLPLNAVSTVWTGRELVVIGSRLDANNRPTSDDVRGAAYDPTANSWRPTRPYRLSPQASAATRVGDEILVWDYELKAALYDPSTDRWRPAAPVPLRPMECYPESVRVGRVVMAWYCGAGATFDAVAERWQRIPRRRSAWLGPVPAGSVALFLGAGRLSAYRP
jgi:hypothetical protein